MRFRDVVTVIRDGPSIGQDAYGNALPGPPVRISLPAQVNGPDRNSPEVPGRQAAIAYYDVIAGPGADVMHLDRVEWRGQVYEVDGAPVVHGHRHRLAHLAFTIKQVRE